MIDPEARIVNVLLVEDDPGDVLMTREAFDEYLHNRLDVVTDGAAALSYLRHEEPYGSVPRPDLILLDLNLPRKDGREVLRELKQSPDPELRRIPVAALTTSALDRDILTAYEQHANAYITKPVDLDQFVSVINAIDAFWLSVARLPDGH
jgi:CheY-like chemotaxis protein